MPAPSQICVGMRDGKGGLVRVVVVAVVMCCCVYLDDDREHEGDDCVVRYNGTDGDADEIDGE